MQLPEKTTSFKEWALRLDEYAGAEALAQETGYWTSAVAAPAATIPEEMADHATNTWQSAEHVYVRLDPETTRALLEKTAPTYRAEVQDVLLTALARSLIPWTGHDAMVVDLEGHGREGPVDVDVSRTVGWFTSLFPVTLHLGASGLVAEQVKVVKEQLRRIPNRGIGFGLLRYASKNTRIPGMLAALPVPPVSFNYLGQFGDQRLGYPFTGWAVEPVGMLQAPGNARSHKLDIIAMVTDRGLEVDWIYGRHLHTRLTITGLAERFKQELLLLIGQATDAGGAGLSPSDFPLAGLDADRLDNLTELLAKSEGSG
jgi:non-ribosomal peptide synthase protein (TIGR01720 family)